MSKQLLGYTINGQIVGVDLLHRILNSDLEEDLNRILVGSRTTELTLEDYPLMDDKAEMPIRSYDRKIQEEINV
jgi:hypothetical protein